MRNIQILGTLILCLCSLMLVPNQVYTQSSSEATGLEVIVDDSSNAYFNINFEKGQTLYSICKQFHIATIDAMMLNEIVNPDQISIGERLLLPLNKEFFKVKKPSGSGYIPVYYTVKKQETLFRISKVYFAQDVKDMIERNELSGFTLAIDQKLLVGYYQTETNYPFESQQVVASTNVTKPTPITPVKENSPVIERPAISEPATQTKPTEKTSTADEYVLVDKNVVSQEKIRKTQAIAIEETPKQVIIETPTKVIDQSKPVITETAIEEISNSEKEVTNTPSPERVIIQRESSEVVDVHSGNKEVETIQKVDGQKGKPSFKERLKKVIGSEKLDHDVADNKTEQTNAEVQAEMNEEVVDTSVDTIQSSPIEVKPSSNLVSQSKKGIAYWDKKGKDYENLMVLHKSAEVNTLIKLTNPVNGLSTFARVVGKIPENAFKKDIDVVLSPAVARKIGAIDSRMQIAMTYQIIKP